MSILYVSVGTHRVGNGDLGVHNSVREVHARLRYRDSVHQNILECNKVCSGFSAKYELNATISSNFEKCATMGCRFKNRGLVRRNLRDVLKIPGGCERLRTSGQCCDGA